MSEGIRLNTKVQYKGFETGEYTSIEARTKEEVVALIEHFPWDEQRHTPVKLTGPSIVVEDIDGRYLKFAHYYNPKFCFYYVDEKGKFYKKVLTDIADASPVIESFYDGNLLMDGFVRDSTQFGHLRHFRTEDFTYRPTFRRSVQFLAMPLLFTLSCLWLLLYFGLPDSPAGYFVSSFAFLMWFLLFGLSFVFFINYYLYSKDLFIRISQGLDEFEFGTDDNYNTYNKKDVVRIKCYVVNYDSTHEANKIIEIIFKDGSKIKFPSLLIGFMTLFVKFNAEKDERIVWKEIERRLPLFIRD